MHHVYVNLGTSCFNAEEQTKESRSKARLSAKLEGGHLVVAGRHKKAQPVFTLTEKVKTPTATALGSGRYWQGVGAPHRCVRACTNQPNSLPAHPPRTPPPNSAGTNVQWIRVEAAPPQTSQMLHLQARSFRPRQPMVNRFSVDFHLTSHHPASATVCTRLSRTARLNASN